MQQAQQLWAWLDGKKTIIGAIIVGLAAALHQLGYLDGTGYQTVTQFGVAVSTVGLGFKLQKLLDEIQQ